MLVYR